MSKAVPKTVKLVKPVIDRAFYGGDGRSRDVRWDEKLKGFGLRVYPTGRKAFVVSYRVRRRKRLMVIGDVGSMTLHAARIKARRMLVAIEDGADPLEEKRLSAGGKTFGELVDAYVERHAKARKKTWDQDRRRLNRHVPRSWRSRTADSIKAWEVAELHDRIGRRAPYEANRLLEIVRKMYRLAPKWGYLAPSDLNPAVGIEKFQERQRKRWVTAEELPRLAAAIDIEPSLYVRAALWLCLLTGARKAELLEAKWADVDWSRAMLRLPDTKAGDEQQAALSGPALAILQATPRVAGNPYIFPGRKKGQHLVNIDKPWHRIRKTAKVEDVRLHDLRRTVGSWMSQSGADLNVVRDALRHRSIATTLVYARLGADPARQAMEAHGRRMLEVAGRKGPLAVAGNKADG